MEGEDRSEVLLEFFKALGDEKRLQIVGLLARQDYSVEELAAILGLSSATVSHHLQRLARLGLVTARADQHYHVYSLRLQTLHELSAQILSGEGLQEVTNDLDLDAYDRKVLRDYMEGGRLKSWPHKWKKRQVILRYLLEQFEPDQHYSEREVNEIIGRVHPDFATLRREMIETGLMARERDVYWRKEQ
ncbi:MAG: metalloregulator ArsR/SmtB family transcription factor [Anaerolineaceae bacterium]|nr:metalloregulator ArsR/SmtB family transcription factor [Anaerolineaceae bacterium]